MIQLFFHSMLIYHQKKMDEKYYATESAWECRLKLISEPDSSIVQFREKILKEKKGEGKKVE